MVFKVFDFDLFGSNNDNIQGSTATEKAVDYKAALDSETGWERLKKVFEVDEFSNVTPELNNVLQTGAMSMLIGALYGGIIDSRVAYMDFMKNNQATAFQNHWEAKKKLQDKVTLAFGKGAFKWGWRLTVFSVTYASVSTTVSVYRGKSGLIEHVAGGLISGALYKFNMGPRGWIVGGGLGGVLGFCAGLFTQGLLKLTGMTTEETRYWNYYWQKERLESLRRMSSKQKEKSENSPFSYYDSKIGSSDDKLINIENK